MIKIVIVNMLGFFRSQTTIKRILKTTTGNINSRKQHTDLCQWIWKIRFNIKTWLTSTTRWSWSCWMIMSHTVVLPEAVPPDTPNNSQQHNIISFDRKCWWSNNNAAESVEYRLRKGVLVLRSVDGECHLRGRRFVGRKSAALMMTPSSSQSASASPTYFSSFRRSSSVRD